MQVLLFCLNGREYGVSLENVDFISKSMKVVKVPDALETISGIVMLRGKTVPVYNLALHFGYMKQETEYLLVVNVDDIKIAPEVEMVDRVIWIEKEAMISLPVIIRTKQPCFQEAFVYEGKLIGLLDISGLLSRQGKKELDLLIEKNAKKYSYGKNLIVERT